MAANYAGSVKARKNYLAKLDAQEKEAVKALLVAYREAQVALEKEAAKILDGSSPLVGSASSKEARLAVLIGRRDYLEEQVAKYLGNPEEVAKFLQAQFPKAYSLGTAFGAEQLEGLSASLVRPNENTIKEVVARYQSSTVWREYFSEFAKGATDEVIAAATTSVILGEGIDATVRRIRGTVKMGEARLRTAVRTQIIGAARMGTLDMYRRNPNVVKGWIWRCNAGPRTCAVCWAMNGSEHPPGANFSTHPNCRCYSVPMTKTYEEILGDAGYSSEGIVETGAQGFDADEFFAQMLTPKEQRQVLGPGRYALWADGKITLRQMVATTTHPKWGPGLRLRTVEECKQIVAGGIKPEKVLLKPSKVPTPPTTTDAIEGLLKTANTPDAPPPPNTWIDADVALGTKTGGPAGSNTGGPTGFWTGTDGVKRYVKAYDNPGQAYSEMVANRLYAELGVRVPPSRLSVWTDPATGQQRTLIINDILENQGTIAQKGLTKARADEILDGMGADTWLANWDAVGTGLDNVVVLMDGTLARIDQGGALLFRAKGAPKPTTALAKADVEDFWGANPYYRKVLQEAGYPNASSVANLPEQVQAIRALVDSKGGVTNLIDEIIESTRQQALSKGITLDIAPAQRDLMSAVLKKRLEYLEEKFPPKPPASVIDAVAAKQAAKSAVEKALEEAEQLIAAGKTKKQVETALKKQGYSKHAAKHAADKKWYEATGSSATDIATKTQHIYNELVEAALKGGPNVEAEMKKIGQVWVKERGASPTLVHGTLKKAISDTKKAASRPGKPSGTPDIAPAPKPLRGAGTRADTDIPNRPASAARDIDEAVARIDSGERAAHFQWDGDGIEALDVRVRPALVDGETGWYQVRMKLTAKQMREISEDAEFSSFDYPMAVMDPKTGRVELIKTKTEARNRVGSYIYRTLTRKPGMRTIKWRKKGERGFIQSDPNLRTYGALHGELVVYTKNPGAKFMDDLMKRVKIESRRPRRDDQIAYAENALKFFFNDGTGDGAAALARARRFGVTPEDVVFEYDDRGRMTARLPDDATRRLLAETGVKSFFHRINGDALRSLDDWVAFIESPEGLLSTTQRWVSGINTHGMSSAEDLGTGGADYVFTRHSPVEGKLRDRVILFDPRIIGRLDFYAWESDKYGRILRNNPDTIGNLGNFSGSSRESMFKHRLGWDVIDSVGVPQTYYEELIREAAARGITTLGGRPIRDVLKPA